MSVRLGVIGGGQVFRRLYQPALAGIEEASVVALADPVAQLLPGVRHFASAEEMLATMALDGVLVLSPPALHAAHVTLATARGVRVLVEKPAAVSAAEVEQRALPELVTPALSRRYWPRYRAAALPGRKWEFTLQTNPGEWGARDAETPERDLLPHAIDLASRVSGESVVGVEQVVRRPGRVSGVFVLSAGGQFRWALSHGADYVERLTRDGRVVADGPPGRREVAIQRLRRQPPVEVAAVDALLRDWLATFQGATASGLPTVEDARVCGRIIEEVEAAPMAAAGGSGRSTTVVIPVKDDRRIEQAVASVVALKPSQLIVVNNGSEAEFGEWLRTALPAEVELIEEAVASVYRARNLAVARATGDVVFFTDADCVVEPGWISAGLEAIADGADLVQGYSGLHGEGRAQHLLQGRYEAHLRKLRRGDGTECDTRNLAVRRSVFDTLTFNEGFRRVGDTEFGLLAEAAGYRVGYEPEMRVAHSHDPDLRLFAAKQVCHGWGAQRLMQDHPEIRWHGGHLQLVSRVSTRLAGFPPSRFLAPLCTWGSLQSARALEFAAPYIPRRLGFLWLTGIDKLAALGGHFAYRPGAEEPSPSRILKRRVPRD